MRIGDPERQVVSELRRENGVEVALHFVLGGLPAASLDELSHLVLEGGHTDGYPLEILDREGPDHPHIVPQLF